MRVSLLSGVMVARDAISTSTWDKALALRKLFAARQRPLSLKIYVLGSDYPPDPDIKIVSGVEQVLGDAHFRDSELVIYDFGIFHELFDTIRFTAPNAQRWVHFHNITPEALVPEAARPTVRRSLVQMVNLLEADRVLVASSFNRQAALDYGVEPARIAPLAYVVEAGEAGLQSPAGERTELLYVGRFVRSKGILELLEAYDQALQRTGLPARLSLVGSLTFSDPEYLAQVQARVQALGLGEALRLVGEVSDEDRNQLYRSADALLIPSYHEGFCVPVVEALGHGCFIIGYAAGSLPSVVNGLGNLVPPGDIQELAEKIARFLRCRTQPSVILEADRGPMDQGRFFAEATHYAQGFSRDHFEGSLATLLEDIPSWGRSQDPLLQTRIHGSSAR